MYSNLQIYDEMCLRFIQAASNIHVHCAKKTDAVQQPSYHLCLLPEIFVHSTLHSV